MVKLKQNYANIDCDNEELLLFILKANIISDKDLFAKVIYVSVL